MLDFLMTSSKINKNVTIIYPKFIIKKSNDLMIRGGDFYAVWMEDKQLWSTDEQDAIKLIDNELKKYAEDLSKHTEQPIQVMYLWDAESGMIDRWHKYVQKQMRDNFHMLDEKLIFSNSNTNKNDYASKKLDYPLENGDYSSYDKLIGTLYSPEERHKIEWSIGSIVSGDSKYIQKFVVMYGSAGTGKSTILNIIQKLFNGYYTVFDAKALGMNSNAFALEAFKTNPLVAIQHDGDLSRIEDNTRLNSLVSHELMTVNEKFKSTYNNQFKCFLFIGTNKPVKITDAKSGLMRRLIDVSPSGDKLSVNEYNNLMDKINFELGAIAFHCKEVYQENIHFYDDYVPIKMMDASNDFYNFMYDSYFIFKDEDGTSLKAAWEMYKTYVEEAKIQYPFTKRIFKEELRNYFLEYHDRYTLEDGTRLRSYYNHFKTDVFDSKFENGNDNNSTIQNDIISFKNSLKKQESNFDKFCSQNTAQYATDDGYPLLPWDKVNTKLNELDTSNLHYVRVDSNHIVIDFDLVDSNGNKSLEKNIEAALKWPKTYTELSKSGNGLHLHYIYTGDPTKLSRIYDDKIEVKVYTGKSSLRRKLTLCNNSEIASISSGLPLKGDTTDMINKNIIKSERTLRILIERNLNKEIHSATKPSIDFIYKILEDSYNNGLVYDVSDMYNDVMTFALLSTHQSDYCIKKVQEMHFKSEEGSNETEWTFENNDSLAFFDCEVFKNLFLVNWKYAGKDKKCTHMINPSPSEIGELIKNKLIGYNNLGYDNHILYARLLGYNNEQLYDLSKRIINKQPNSFFREAYNLSYADIFDVAGKKDKSLKAWEIELGIKHHELGLDWDKPVPKEIWNQVSEYCDDDVLATEAVFNHVQPQWKARLILADLSGLTPNCKTNKHTTKIIFGDNKHPQGSFNYRNLGDAKNAVNGVTTKNGTWYYELGDPDYFLFDEKGRPVFPGYEYRNGKSTFRDELVSEGGYVYAEPGMYTNVALLDVESMHPNSILDEELFGKEFTKRFNELVEIRIAIKHKNYDKVRHMWNGKLAKYLTTEEDADDLASALKIAINSVYGLTFAHHDNPFRDPRNVDNIVAKRGALFMINLKHEVQKRGFTVAHIKTDSIKIPNATKEIIEYVMQFGEAYGYHFEHEATYSKMCLVNNAVYIAQYDSKGIRNKGGKHANEWCATGAEFAVPYIYKTLFSKEPIIFDDYCVTQSTRSAIYLDMNETLPDTTAEEKQYDKMVSIRKKHEKDPVKNPLDVTDDDAKELYDKVSKGHDYMFIGKVGKFCPVIKNGGILNRIQNKPDIFGNDAYAATTGSSGYRWADASTLKESDKNNIDKKYFNEKVDEAIEHMQEFGDVEWFLSDQKIKSVY